MKVSHSMCGPHKVSDIIFDAVTHFGWTYLTQTKLTIVQKS